MKRGQSSFEYIALVGALLILIIPLFYYTLTTSSEHIKVNQAEDVVSSLTQAADEVYALGPGTSKFVWISMPGTVQTITIDTTEINILLTLNGKPSDVTAFTKAPLTGILPTKQGTYRIKVEHLDNGIVRIGSGNDTSMPIITWTDPTVLACNPVTIRVNTNEPSTCKYDTADQPYTTMTNTMSGSSIGHSKDFGVINEAEYIYYVRCQDASGNQMDASSIISYTVNFSLCGGGVNSEYIPPTVTILQPAPALMINTSQITITYNVTDASPMIWCRLIANTTELDLVLTPTRNIQSNITGNLDQGHYNISVSCRDAFSNEGNSTQQLIRINATLDSDNPIVNVTAPLNGTLRNFNLVKFFYNTTDITSGIKSCKLTITGELDGGGTSNQAVTDFSVNEGELQSLSLSLEKGNHTWNMSCSDDSIYQNMGWSKTWWVRINSTTQEAFISSCAGQCGFEGFSDGVCRQSIPKCEQNNEINSVAGDPYCTGGSQSDTCCCVP